MKRKRLILIFFAAAAVFYSCREKYVPKLKEVSTDYLVVDGYINSGTGPTTISLSRSTPLSNVTKIVRETGATVAVENANGTRVGLTENSPGVYINPQLTIVAANKYRLYIKTKNGKEYVSDFSDVRYTPPIDSVYWKIDANGVQVYADAHDNSTPVGYYTFKYDQTWEFTALYQRLVIFKTNAAGVRTGFEYFDPVKSLQRRYDSSVYTCWKYDTAFRINIASTEKLSTNRVSMQPIVYHSAYTEEIFIRYSIHVKMQQVSKANHQFLDNLKKNTQQLGSIFDAQPSENNGNMRCLTIPSERVIGFVEVSEEKDRRIFINKSQLPPGWKVRRDDVCQEDTLKMARDPNFYTLNEKDYLITREITGDHLTGRIDSVYFSSRYCVDCTTAGTNKKPSFW
jgi:hypothetical protein